MTSNLPIVALLLGIVLSQKVYDGPKINLTEQFPDIKQLDSVARTYFN